MGSNKEWLVIDDSEQELLVKEKFQSFAPEMRKIIAESLGLTAEFLKKRGLSLD